MYTYIRDKERGEMEKRWGKNIWSGKLKEKKKKSRARKSTHAKQKNLVFRIGELESSFT